MAIDNSALNTELVVSFFFPKKSRDKLATFTGDN